MSSAGTVTFWDENFKHSNVEDKLDQSDSKALGRAISFFGDVKGKRILDLGCGLGRFSIAFARLGANVTAVDTSKVAIDRLTEFAERSLLFIECIRGNVMQIETLGRFDFIFGSMILHHLEPFEHFCKSMSSAMNPGGRACFYENNAASRLLIWIRENIIGKLWIPKYGDPDEFPLTPQEVDILKQHFAVTQEFPELLFFGLAAPYLLRGHGRKVLSAIDEFLFSRDILVKYSYRQLLLLQKEQNPTMIG